MSILRQVRDQIIGYLLTTTKEIPIDVREDVHNIRGARLSSPEIHRTKTRYQAHKRAHVRPQLYPGILRVCQQLYAEGIPLLYSEKHQILIWLPEIKRTFPTWYRHRDNAARTVLHESLIPSDPLHLDTLLKGARKYFQSHPRIRIPPSTSRVKTEHAHTFHHTPLYASGYDDGLRS